MENFKEVEDLTEMCLQDSITVDNLRLQLANKLKALGKMSEHCDPNCLRIRERLANRPSKMLRSGKTIAQNGVKLYDGKALTMHIIYSPDIIRDEEAKGDVILLVRMFHRCTLTLDKCKEIYLHGTMSIREIAIRLGCLFNIKPEHLKALIAFSHTDIRLCHLYQDCPRKASRPWFLLMNEKGLLREMYSISSGDVLIIQDSSEVLRDLTPEEKLSIELVEAANRAPVNSSYYPSSYPTYYGPSSYSDINTYGPAPSLATNYKASTRSVSNGIRIKVHKNNSGESSSDLLPHNNSSASTNVGDDLLMYTEDIESSSSSNNNYNNNQSDAEFNRQGGMSLFDDIN
jgi:hypothetical protein